jgi:hypothetical protein
VAAAVQLWQFACGFAATIAVLPAKKIHCDGPGDEGNLKTLVLSTPTLNFELLNPIFMVEMFEVEKFMVEESWLKSLGLKSPGCNGLQPSIRNDKNGEM